MKKVRTRAEVIFQFEISEKDINFAQENIYIADNILNDCVHTYTHPNIVEVIVNEIRAILITDKN